MSAQVSEVCPNCHAQLSRDDRHCASPSCPWARCYTCGASIDRLDRYISGKKTQ